MNLNSLLWEEEVAHYLYTRFIMVTAICYIYTKVQENTEFLLEDACHCPATSDNSGAMF